MGSVGAGGAFENRVVKPVAGTDAQASKAAGGQFERVRGVAAAEARPPGYPLGQNSCCLDRILKKGAIVEERSGEIRTSLQGQSSSAVVAA